jgi:hypothetical protein
MLAQAEESQVHQVIGCQHGIALHGALQKVLENYKNIKNIRKNIKKR